jgi:hypothetical protein
MGAFMVFFANVRFLFKETFPYVETFAIFESLICQLRAQLLETSMKKALKVQFMNEAASFLNELEEKVRTKFGVSIKRPKLVSVATGSRK